MRERHHLGALQMRVSGHRRGSMLRRRGPAAPPAAPQARPADRCTRAVPTCADRLPPGRCGCARCGACPRPVRRARRAGARRLCGCPRRPATPQTCRRTSSAAMARSPASMARCCAAVSTPMPRSMRAWAREPGDVVGAETAVDGEARGVRLDSLGRRRAQAAGPHLGCARTGRAPADQASPRRVVRRSTWSGAVSSSAPCTRVWVRSGRPNSSMNPRAAAWSKVSLTRS